MAVSSNERGVDYADVIVLTNVQNCLGELRKVRPSMTLTQVQMFIAVATRQEAATSKVIGEELGLADSAVSSILSVLTKTGLRNDGTGMGVVEYLENPQDRREKLLRLTPKGRLLVRNMVSELSPVVGKKGGK